LPRPTIALGALAAMGLALFVLIVALQHVLVPSLDPARHQMSEYANGEYGWLMGVAFLSWAVACVSTAVLLRRPGIERGWSRRRSNVIAVLLCGAGAGLVLTACFKTQTSAGTLPPGVERSTEGSIHDLASGAVLITLALAAVVSVPAPESAPGLRRRLIALLLGCAAAALVLLLIGDAVDGVRQRVLVAGGVAWQATLLRALSRLR
jgi:hypothetical protein